MGLNLTVAVLVLAMTFMHSIWGLFSGLMHVFCAIIAMAVAFGFSEAIGASLVKQLGTSPGYTEATVMILLFFGVMLGLRLAADMLVRGNVKIPPTVDWIGGAVCGFIGAEITVGVLLVSIFLLPLGGNVLGFQRYTRNESQTNADHTFMPEFQRAGVWFMPDAFVSGLFSILSDGSLASGTRFSEVYPDYPEWLYFTGNTVQANSTPAPYRDKRADGYRKGISVTKWWEESQLVDDAVYRRDVPDEKKRQPPLSPQEFTATAGNKLIGVRVDLRDDSADRDRGNSVHLFRPTMIRIVGDEDGRPAQYPARAVRAAFSDGG
ncbi:MAG: CvpA family protein, partial [Phycisphaerales bacterium]|nr:CvpA family protein [Phycisphaerales bacterium]